MCRNQTSAESATRNVLPSQFNMTAERRLSLQAKEQNFTGTESHIELRMGKTAQVQQNFMNESKFFYATSVQGEQDKVTVYEKKEGEDEGAGDVVMALCFKKSGKEFISVVDGNNLKLQPISEENVQNPFTNEKCLFKWDEKSGDWGKLKCVAEPDKYLCLEGNKITVGTERKKASIRLKMAQKGQL